jgi:hypothetical protein
LNCAGFLVRKRNVQGLAINIATFLDFSINGAFKGMSAGSRDNSIDAILHFERPLDLPQDLRDGDF